MVDTNELFDGQTPMASDLAEGVQTIALNQKIPFKLYGRVVLPIDGYMFWVQAQLLKRQQFYQSGLVTSGQIAMEEMQQRAFTAKGSMHYTTDFRQEEAENYAGNRMVFTSRQEIQQFNRIAPGTMWIGEFAGQKFGFSASSSRYEQAGLWHYSGFALYPDMQTQVIDDVTQFSDAQVVSNSLPAWLQIAAYQPAWAFWSPLPPLFPSFLVPDNERPPFMAVHIVPESTTALASAPTIDPTTSTHSQLCSDVVRITMWGARNFNALDFVDAVNDYSLNVGAIGIMNVPVVRDEKRTQSEMRTIAMKKTVEFQVSYLQYRMNSIGRQIISSVTAGLSVVDGPTFPLGPITAQQG